MRVQIKKLNPEAVIPEYKSKGASGFDLVSMETYVLRPGQTVLVKTGLAINVGPGCELQVRPRSGVSLKTPLRVANAPGTVDSDYRGEVCVIITNTQDEIPGDGSPTLQVINKGDRIAQGVICPVLRAEFEVVSELDETVRGAGGFGSTGSN